MGSSLDEEVNRHVCTPRHCSLLQLPRSRRSGESTWRLGDVLRTSRGLLECRLCPVGWASENSRPIPPLPPLQACCFLLSDDKFCKELGIFVVAVMPQQ